jgi:hypothetical protein
MKYIHYTRRTNAKRRASGESVKKRFYYDQDFDDCVTRLDEVDRRIELAKEDILELYEEIEILMKEKQNLITSGESEEFCQYYLQRKNERDAYRIDE